MLEQTPLNHESKKYSLSLEEYSYVDQYPPDSRFEKPWEECIQVRQGEGKLYNDGKPLQSEGFSLCSALIIQNIDTQEAALFHIDEIDLHHRQSELLNKLGNGSHTAQFIYGSLSRRLSGRVTQSNYFKEPFSGHRRITVLDDLAVNTGEKHWAIVYEPESRSVFVQSKELKKVLTFKI